MKEFEGDMNFCSVLHYLKVGYRARRSSWAPDSYIKSGILGEIEDYCMVTSYSLGKDENDEWKQTEHNYMSGGCGNDLKIDDLLADDWELITTGIRKEFSKHENGIEYNDDTDWDNYVPSKGGWFSDDEE